MSMRSVESLLEEKFHEKKGIVGKVFGVDITTRFSKEALIGIIAIIGDERKIWEENRERQKDMFRLLGRIDG